jgi:hypothetical protein
MIEETTGGIEMGDTAAVPRGMNDVVLVGERNMMIIVEATVEDAVVDLGAKDEDLAPEAVHDREGGIAITIHEVGVLAVDRPGGNILDMKGVGRIVVVGGISLLRVETGTNRRIVIGSNLWRMQKRLAVEEEACPLLCLRM